MSTLHRLKRSWVWRQLPGNTVRPGTVWIRPSRPRRQPVPHGPTSGGPLGSAAKPLTNVGPTSNLPGIVRS